MLIKKDMYAHCDSYHSSPLCSPPSSPLLPFQIVHWQVSVAGQDAAEQAVSNAYHGEQREGGQESEPIRGNGHQQPKQRHDAGRGDDEGGRTRRDDAITGKGGAFAPLEDVKKTATKGDAQPEKGTRDEGEWQSAETKPPQHVWFRYEDGRQGKAAECAAEKDGSHNQKGDDGRSSHSLLLSLVNNAMSPVVLRFQRYCRIDGEYYVKIDQVFVGDEH